MRSEYAFWWNCDLKNCSMSFSIDQTIDEMKMTSRISETMMFLFLFASSGKMIVHVITLASEKKMNER
jgi:hypothetical protein